MKKQMSMRIGIIILAIIIIFSVLGPLFYHQSSTYTDLYHTSAAPSVEHLLGTDETGRDILARLMEGGRVTIFVGIVATLFKMILSIVAGTIAGYFGGIANQILMRLADIVMCFPFYILAISLAAILGPSIQNLVFIIAFFSWPQSARLIATEVQTLKNKEFIRYYEINGFSKWYILFRHIIPNIKTSLIVLFTLSVAQSVLMESSLSFLGLGVQAPYSSWGMMLSSAMNIMSIEREWWLWLPAGILVLLMIFSIHLIGEGQKSKGGISDVKSN